MENQIGAMWELQASQQMVIGHKSRPWKAGGQSRKDESADGCHLDATQEKIKAVIKSSQEEMKATVRDSQEKMKAGIISIQPETAKI
jgi:hypothetical protein